jgi:hypothetical protein
MKYFSKLLLAATGFVAMLSACKKAEDLPFYNNGSPVTLSSSVRTVAATAADSSKSVLALTWTSPNYASAEATNKYIVQIDTANGNFANPYSKEVTGVTSVNLSTSFTAKEINNILIGNGIQFGKEANLVIRILSSYSNNNEQLLSNVVAVKATPYSYAFDLNASDAGPFSISIANKDQVLQTFGWSRPNVGNGTYTYKLQYDKAGNNFASVKSVDVTSGTSFGATGSNLNKFAQDAGVANGQAGEVEFRILATLNGIQSFVSAVKKFTITPADLIAYLYVPGDYQGWKPELPSAFKLASTNLETYEGYVYLTNTNGFKFTNSPDWNHTNYGDGGAGKLNPASNAGNLNVPTAGYYLFKANIPALTWSATAITTWGIIGDATPGGWGNSTPLTYDAVANVWKATITFSGGTTAFKFRANDAWDIDLGGTGTFLSYGGGNISSPAAGTYTVTLDLSNPLKYKYTIQ